jgi:hypothetical protein
VAIIGNKGSVYDGSLCDRRPGTRYVVVAGFDFSHILVPVLRQRFQSEHIYTFTRVVSRIRLFVFSASAPSGPGSPHTRGF